MEQTVIKDFYGKILGKIREYPNGDKVAYDFYGRILGKYNKISNKTYDFYGKILSQGDTLVSLITSSNSK